MVVAIMQAYAVFTIVIMLLYAVRHFVFSYSRLYGRQRISYSDIADSDLPRISVLIPMHNEEKVLRHVLDALLECQYDRDKLEIIPINDHSSDATHDLLEEYASLYPHIRPFHRTTGRRGKTEALSEAVTFAKNDIIIVFDADYRPGKMMLQRLAVGFLDPSVGAVMGRVVPSNTHTNLLTRLLSIERSGGYQVDQQARYNLNLIPQYGGTVGGFRKEILPGVRLFGRYVLAEDTEITMRLYLSGYRVLYVNDAECYEESPETWASRGRQVRRWSRGHNNVMFRYFWPLVLSKAITLREKIDGIFLLMVYATPFLLLLAFFVSLALFFLGEMTIFMGWWVLLFVGMYNSYGNFAPFYEIATGLILDGMRGDILLIPLMIFNFYFYLWHTSLGFVDAIVDRFSARDLVWNKTQHFGHGPGGTSAPGGQGQSVGG